MKARLSQIIAKQQVSNQIHYNRAIVQIGLCAFRLGLFEECNNILVDVCQSPKLKESLAQGTSNFSRQQEKTIEEENEVLQNLSNGPEKKMRSPVGIGLALNEQSFG